MPASTPQETSTPDGIQADKPFRRDPAAAALLLLVAGLGLAAMQAGLQRWAVTSSEPQAVLMRIDVNRADAATLQLLPGVGPALSQRIVAARRERPFTRPTDLRRIHGIGPVLARRARPYLQFSGAERPATDGTRQTARTAPASGSSSP